MELSIDEVQARKLFKEVIMQLITERQDWFLEIILEAIEESGLAEAIREGRRNDFVSEEEIQAILPG